ncbi:heme-binding domain-containing protein [Edaphobacter sp. 12200R-103]|uniref:heme-binding domain-containing protein n=1 Tax=Edaphobacter sp. 12200R-103 TaxID=2703788 RepID=UPI00138DB8EC|nr:heme-binding domain-containing protein [Edaphobacter sp. 12200R-103]QHS52603.1 cytochrome P460 [Edaphobacter sp. 12200R-103]
MEARSTVRILTYLVLLFFAGFLAIQFVRPTLANPPVTAEVQAPPEVKRILRSSCYDCHSNQTRLLWFDRIQPAYSLVVKDVNAGRARLNFSEIAKLPAGQQKGALYEALNQAQLGAMPLPRYTLLHPRARISDNDLAVLKNYLHPASSDPAVPNPEVKAAADAQCSQWIHTGPASPPVSPAPNGIMYLPGYRDWKVVSTTNRFDNHTLRIIFGNDVAVRAIAEHRINPWPQGTTFAKAAWAQQVDDDGNTRAGSFIQVEFMIKDSRKYASTGGWGYARWRGLDLKPYGKDAAFTNECVGCHTPVRRNDYVYTFPIEGQQ